MTNTMETAAYTLFDIPEGESSEPVVGASTKLSYIKSKQRVADHGEVLTGEREVNAMLDLVKQEAENIESRFLEPACGTGNFLFEILRRKLMTVTSKYGQSQLEWERKALLAITSIYGIDILEDNIEACRECLYDLFHSQYLRLFKAGVREECCASVRFVLSLNIIQGDALTLQTVQTAGSKPGPIIFAQWSPVHGSLLKRRDFVFAEMIPTEGEQEPNLFSTETETLRSDTGDPVFIPTPIREFPLTHFLEIANATEE